MNNIDVTRNRNSFWEHFFKTSGSLLGIVLNASGVPWALARTGRLWKPKRRTFELWMVTNRLQKSGRKSISHAGSSSESATSSQKHDKWAQKCAATYCPLLRQQIHEQVAQTISCSANKLEGGPQVVERLFKV